MLNILMETMINVPLITGVFYIRWRVLVDDKLAGKGRTTNSIVKNFKVNWNETARLENVQENLENTIVVEFVACQMEDSESKQVGVGKISFRVRDHTSGGTESWTLLFEESKFNAGLKVTTWFGAEKPELLQKEENVSTTDSRTSKQKVDDVESDYSCSSNEYRENKKIIDEIFNA